MSAASTFMSRLAPAMAYGRDAADVTLTTTCGVCVMQSFRVWTDEIPAA